MSKEYFTEHINEETLVGITDKMLRFEKRQGGTGIKRSLLKLIPAVAAIALLIGLMNILPIFLNTETDAGGFVGSGKTEYPGSLTDETERESTDTNYTVPTHVDSIDFKISLKPEQYNENPFSSTPYDGTIVNKIIYSAAELESMLSDEWFGLMETDGAGQESMYTRQLTYIYDDGYFKDNALIAVTFEYASMAIPKSIYKVEIRDENYLTAWAYQFEDMSLPENEKFKSGLYPARVFLIEVSRADVEGVAEVWPGIDGAPVVVLPEMTTENTAPPYSYYPVFDKIEKINIGNGYESENDTVFVLSDEERLELWRLMRIDEWIVASDLPHEVPGAVFSIFEKPDKIDAMAFQSWAFKQYGEQLLIIPALPDENSVKICYFAPFDILTDIMAFIEMR